MGETEEFIAKFYNLSGITIAERTKSLFHLFYEYSFLQHNEQLLQSITTNLIPRNHLEKIFVVEFQIYFHRFEELSIEFLKGDDIVVSKIAKQTWFFQKLLHKFGTELVSRFLPNLSYNMRLKILKKLIPILDEKQSDQLFDELLTRYGLFIATNVLPSCSSAKIELILRNQPVKLWTSQMKQIYRKNPNLVCIYLEERVKHEGDTKFLNNNQIFSFIALNNPEMFCNLQEKYKFKYCKIGKRATKKLVRTQKENILAKPEVYVHNLNSAKLVRTLGSDFKEIYFKLFPRTPATTCTKWNDAAKLLNYYPKNKKFSLFKLTFDQMFYNSLERSHNLINNYVLDLILDSDEREKWTRIKLEHDKSEHYMKYLRAENCIKSFQEKLNSLSQLSKRIECVAILTECCIINKDWDSLITICQLLCTRFKNDDKSLHSKFLHIINSKSVLENLNEIHWKYIKQIIVKGENFDSTLICLNFQKKGFLSEAELTNLLKNTNWVSKLDDVSRPVLLLLIKIAPQIIKDNDRIEKTDILLIEACKKNNLGPTSDTICIFEYPRLINSLKYVLVHDGIVENHIVASVIEWIICTNKRDDQIEELVELYWSNFQPFIRVETIIWFLRYRPEIIANNMERILNVAIAGQFCYTWNNQREQTKLLWRVIKCYTHLGFDQKLIELCSNKFRNDDFDQKLNVVEAMSVVMPTQDFLTLAATYKPETYTVDEKMQPKFRFQRGLLKSFVNLQEPEIVVSVILQFLAEDYVASCLSPLYSCLYRIPENRVKAISDKLCNTRAVSIKKHGFYFICITQDELTVLKSIKSCHLTQSLAMAFQHFVKNPTESSWELVKSKLGKLDNNDHFTSLLLVNKPVPKNYKGQYFENAYTIFRKKQNKFANVLTDKLHEDTIGQLPIQFFISVKNDFLVIRKMEFIFAYFLLSSANSDKFDVIFDTLRIFKENHWSFRSQEARNKLNNFIKIFFNAYLEWNKSDAKLVTTFLKGFQVIFAPVEVFEEFLFVSLMEIKNVDQTVFCKSVLELNRNLIDNYGKLSLVVFANCVKTVLNKLYSDEESCKFEFYSKLFDLKERTDDVLLLMYLLPKNSPQLRQSATLYYKLLDLLKQTNNDNLQVHLHLFLKQQN